MEKENCKTHLYFIRDRLSGVPETAVIQCINDAVAVRGFKDFLQANDKTRKEQNLPLIAPIERELVHICGLDEENRIIENDYRLVTAGDRVNTYLEEIHEGLRGE